PRKGTGGSNPPLSATEPSYQRAVAERRVPGCSDCLSDRNPFTENLCRDECKYKRNGQNRFSRNDHLSGGSTIGSGGCDSGHGRLYLVAISPTTRSQCSFPKLL